MDVQCQCIMVYTFVAVFFTRTRIRQAFLAQSHYFNWVMGLILAILALYVVYEVFIG